jgi:hypothetical protein
VVVSAESRSILVFLRVSGSLYLSFTSRRGEKERAAMDGRNVLDFSLEALLFFGRALDGASVLRVRLPARFV